MPTDPMAKHATNPRHRSTPWRRCSAQARRAAARNAPGSCEAGVDIIDPATTYIERGRRDRRRHRSSSRTRRSAARRRSARLPHRPEHRHRRLARSASAASIFASVIEGAAWRTACDVGPFSHLRAGSHLETGVHLGNFVEVKAFAAGPGHARPATSATSATPRSARTSTSAPARSPATTTARRSTRPSSKTAPSSAATRCWWRRCARPRRRDRRRLRRDARTCRTARRWPVCRPAPAPARREGRCGSRVDSESWAGVVPPGPGRHRLRARGRRRSGRHRRRARARACGSRPSRGWRRCAASTRSGRSRSRRWPWPATWRSLASPASRFSSSLEDTGHSWGAWPSPTLATLAVLMLLQALPRLLVAQSPERWQRVSGRSWRWCGFVFARPGAAARRARSALVLHAWRRRHPERGHGGGGADAAWRRWRTPAPRIAEEERQMIRGVMELEFTHRARGDGAADRHRRRGRRGRVRRDGAGDGGEGLQPPPGLRGRHRPHPRHRPRQGGPARTWRERRAATDLRESCGRPTSCRRARRWTSCWPR